MSKILIKFQADYADEFDVYGFTIQDQSWWDKHLQEVAGRLDEEGTIERYFGTNECVEFHSLEQYTASFTVTPITDDEFQVFKKLFNGYRNNIWFGHVLLIE